MGIIISIVSAALNGDKVFSSLSEEMSFWNIVDTGAAIILFGGIRPSVLGKSIWNGENIGETAANELAPSFGGSISTPYPSKYATILNNGYTVDEVYIVEKVYKRMDGAEDIDADGDEEFKRKMFDYTLETTKQIINHKGMYPYVSDYTKEDTIINKLSSSYLNKVGVVTLVTIEAEKERTKDIRHHNIQLYNFSKFTNAVRITLPEETEVVDPYPLRQMSKNAYVQVNPRNRYLTDDNGILFSLIPTTPLDMSTANLKFFPSNYQDKDGQYVTTYNLPMYVDSAWEVTFSGRKNVQFRVTRIESRAVSVTYLESITIPRSVTYIGANAFSGSSLTKITFSTEIDYDDENWYSPIDTFIPHTFASSYFKKITIPPTITDMSGAFAFSRVEEIDFIQDWAGGSGPATIKGYSFSGATYLKTITIGRYTGTIESYAFINTPSLLEIKFEEPVKLTHIYPYTFYKSGLKKFTIPKLISYIQEYAFLDSSLNEIIFDQDSTVNIINARVFQGASYLTTITIPKLVTSIGEYAFQGTSSLNEVLFGSDSLITSIESYTFKDSGLTTITIPKLVTRIKHHAFQGTISLNEVLFEQDSSLNTIESYTFKDSGLTTITIPNSVTSIDEYAFQGTSSLNEVLFEQDSQLYRIIDNVFKGSGLKKITIPKSVHFIDSYAFLDSSLNEVLFEQDSNLRFIDSYVFKDSGLTTITIPKSVTSIESYAFLDSSLNEIIFEQYSSFNTINARVFQGASYLTTITIPKLVTSIGDHAFLGTSSLTEVLFEQDSSLTTIESYAFDESGLTTITIPNSVTIIGALAFRNTSDLTHVSITSNTASQIDLFTYVDANNNHFGILNKFFFISGSTATLNTLLPSDSNYASDNSSNIIDINVLGTSNTTIGGGPFKSVVFNDVVERISAAFFTLITNSENLQEIKVDSSNNNYSDASGVLYNKDKTSLIYYPRGITDASFTVLNSVTSIGNDAFKNATNLQSITIPSSVTSIGNFAFEGTSNLTTFVINDISNSVLETIGTHAFKNASKLESFTIPSSVTKIGANAFQGTAALSSFVFNDIDDSSLNTIESSTFAFASSLTTITIPNSVTKIENFAFEGTRLDSFTISNNITRIEKEAFKNVQTLQTIHIPEFVEFIGSDVFYGATDMSNITVDSSNNNYSDVSGVLYNKDITTLILYPPARTDTSFTLPSTVTSIETNALYNIRNLQAIHVEDGNTTYSSIIGVLCDYNKSKILRYPPARVNNSYTPPPSIENIEDGAFRQDANLVTIYLYTNVFNSLNEDEDLDNKWVYNSQVNFYSYGLVFIRNVPTSTIFTLNDDSIIGVSINGIINEDSYNSTINKNDIVSVVLGTTVTGISENAFQSASKIVSITLPTSINDISSNAFQTTPSFEYVYIPESVLTELNIPLSNDNKLSYTNMSFYGSADTVNIKDPESITTFLNDRGNIINIDISGALTSDIITSNNLLFYYDGRVNSDKIMIISVKIGTGVTSIGDEAFKYTIRLKEVIIPNSVTSIGEEAFYSSTINILTIPDSVISIGNRAFNSSYLTHIHIPNSVTSIGEGAFTDTMKLSHEPSLTFAENSSLTDISDNVFQRSQLKTITIPNSVISIGTSCFGNSALNEIGFESDSSLNSIGSLAFQYTKFTTITIPNSVTSIGTSCFRYSLVEEIIFEQNSSLTSIGIYSFTNATALTTITIPDSVTSIAHGAFKGTFSLITITIPNSVKSIDSTVFENSSLNEILFEPNSSLNTIGNNCFKNTNLTSITIPNSVTSIGRDAFFNSSVEEIIFEQNSSLTTIPIESFKGTSSLTSVTIPDSVTSIADSAFEGASSLTSFTIPNSVESIGDSVFKDSSLNEIIFEQDSSLNTIGNNCFKNTNLTSITIPNSVESIGDSAFEDSSLNEIIFEQDSSLDTIGGDCFKNTNLTSITIPESVTSIGANAFHNSPLEIVYISENTLATLNVDLSANSQSQLSYTEMSFYGSNTTVIKNINTRTKIFLENGNYTYISSDASGILTTSLIVRNDIQKVDIASVIVGTDVKIIEAGTFSGTPKLESITINQGVNAIGRGAFYGASNLQELIYAGGMNSALTTIGIDAFKNTYSLKSTIIPQNITSIGVNAFNCNSSEVYTPSMEKIYIFKKTLDTLNVDLSANSQLSYTEMSFYGSNNVNLINPRGMTTFTLNTESVIFIDIIGELSNTSYSSEIQDKNTIRSLQLGNRVTSIGSATFKDTQNLEEVNFYNIRYSKLTEIGDSAFRSSNLKKITIPASVTDIGITAFGYTYNLDEVTFYEISNSKLKNIAWGAFYHSNKLKKITIPSSIREIGQNAFAYAVKLEKVIFYDITNVHIHIIGANAFNETTSLTEITLPGAINNISPVNSPKEIFKYSGLNTVYIENREGSDFDTEIQAGLNADFYGAINVNVYTFKDKLENTANILSSSFKDLMRNKFSDYDDIFNDTIIGSIDKGYLPINTLYKIQVTIPSKDLTDLSEEERNSLISDIKSMYATILYVSEDELMVDLEQGSVIINISVVEPPVVAPICFPAGTPVNTDQGIICIEKLNPSKHTVDGKEIVAITQSRPIFEEIVSIKKNALSKNVPSQTTEISKEHMVCYKNKMTKACELVKICDGVDFIPYSGEILYNVLLKEHSLMMINNMKCETLHPENIMAKIYTSKCDKSDKQLLLKQLSKIIKNEDIYGYIKLHGSVKYLQCSMK